VTAEPAVDLATARGVLTQRFGAEISDVVAAPRQGTWSTTYFFRDAARELVIRFADTAWNFEKDQFFSRHSSVDLPIPRMVAIGSVPGGCHYAVSERAHGAFLEELDAPAMRAALPAVFRALDAMRSVDLSDTAGFGSPLPNFDGERSSWRDFLLAVADDDPELDENPVRGWWKWLESQPEAVRTFRDAYAAMTSRLDVCPEARHLVHGDLLYGNVLVDHERVSGVFDWQCACYGDFLYDLAWLTFWSPWYPGLAAVDVRAEARRHYDALGLDVPGFDGRMYCYELHIGLAHLGYHAWREEWRELKATARRTREVLAVEHLS
jgi:aminoglycoside phosphotransferase (APT) family kinase protein